MKNFFAIFEDLSEIHLGKDVFMLPYYLTKDRMRCTILYSNNKELPLNFRGVDLNYQKNIINYLFKEAKNIDELMLFHLTKKTCYYGILYKVLNRQGKLFIKFDTGLNNIQEFNEKKWKWGRIKISILRRLLLKLSDRISVETQESYDYLKKTSLYNLNISSKLLHIANGFDEELLDSLKIRINNYEEKENIMLTVGRLGTLEKNNELLLKALDGLDLKNWKIFLIGPCEEKFKIYYDNFLTKNPDKKETVILTGNIEDKKELLNYYNKSKVFLLTSRSEGFPLVFPEALRFGNYILTTDVSGSKDITANSTIGKVISNNDCKMLRNEIEKILKNEIDTKEKYKESIDYSTKNFIWKNIIKKCGIDF